MTWGGYDLDKYSLPGNNFKFHNLTKDSIYWLIKLNDISLSNTTNSIADTKYKFGNESGNYTDLIIDSGTSYTQFPSTERDKFHSYLVKEQNLNCSSHQFGILCNCSGDNYLDHFPDFNFHMGGGKYILPKENYVRKRGDRCALMIMSGHS